MAEPTPTVGRTGKPPSPQEASRIAGYPPAPSSFLGAPSYALAVRRRQRALRASIGEINERLKKAEAERDGAEAQLGQAAVDYGLITGHEAEQLKSKVAEAERSVSGARERKTQADEHYEREKVRLAEALGKVRTALEPYASWQKDLEEKLKLAEASHARAEATVKRLEIEGRNIDQLAARGGGADPQAAARRKAEVAAQRARCESELRSSADAVSRARTESDQLQAQLAPLARQRDELERQLGELTRDHDERVGAHSEQQKLASNWRRSRLAIIGRQIFDVEPRPKLLDAERLYGRIDQSRAKVARVQGELELSLAALDAHDHEAMDRARYLLFGSAGLLGVVLLALMLYAC